MRSKTATTRRQKLAARQYLPIVGVVLFASAWLGPRDGAAQFFSTDRGRWSNPPTVTPYPDTRRYRAPRQDGFFGRLFGVAPGFEFERPQVQHYRTLCVRLCDGYYWPMSFAASRQSFKRDAQRCESSCATPAKLFVYRNPGGSVEHMYDLQGQPYSRLPNAFRYRKEYLKDCRCRPEPWSEAALEDYKQRALAEKAERDKEKALAETTRPVPDAKTPAVARWQHRRRSRPRYARPRYAQPRYARPRYDTRPRRWRPFRWWTGR